jgi:two-component system, OmpR family, response regulator
MNSIQDSGHILIVDDDPAVLSALREILELENYKVDEACNGDEMRLKLSKSTFDLITLDIGLPGKSGLELAREIRQNSNIPIIVVSARSTDVDRIVGLEVGADDYIVKPFNIREVVARVRAVLRRSAEGGLTSSDVNRSSVLKFHGNRFNTQSRKLTLADGETAVLTSAEGSLLEFLFKNEGRVCSRDEITAALKGHEWSPFDRSLDTLIGRLRKKIEPEPDSPSLILSIRGIGYRLTASNRLAAR